MNFTRIISTKIIQAKYVFLLLDITVRSWADPGDRGSGPPPPPPEKSQKNRVSLKYWSGSPENHKATKPAFNDGPFIAVFGSYIPSSTKKNVIKFGLPLTKLSGSAHAALVTISLNTAKIYFLQLFACWVTLHVFAIV